jgi:hypothetical protein
MIIIEHRINTLEQLRTLPPEHGAEIDLRSDCSSGKIHMHHDPFVKGVDFEVWASLYAERKIRGPLILNTKEDALETRIKEICERVGIDNYFFLDTALPTLIKWSIKNGESRFACRVSAYEPVSALKAFHGKVRWAWVDCFDGIPMSSEDVSELKKHFKVCLVAPELQGIQDVHQGFGQIFGLADAICTKKPKYWLDFKAS